RADRRSGSCSMDWFSAVAPVWRSLWGDFWSHSKPARWTHAVYSWTVARGGPGGWAVLLGDYPVLPGHAYQPSATQPHRFPLFVRPLALLWPVARKYLLPKSNKQVITSAGKGRNKASSSSTHLWQCVLSCECLSLTRSGSDSRPHP